jgi:hypothetical protein
LSIFPFLPFVVSVNLLGPFNERLRKSNEFRETTNQRRGGLGAMAFRKQKKRYAISLEDCENVLNALAAKMQSLMAKFVAATPR